jgi:hypothetical protein
MTTDRAKKILETVRGYLGEIEEVFDEYYALDKGASCSHSFTDAVGVGGGYIFRYCNKCGITKEKKVFKKNRIKK